MKLRTKLLLLAALIIVVILVVQYTGIIQYCSLESLQKHSEYLRCFVNQRYFLAVLTYIGAYAAFIAAAIPSAAPLGIAGGYLFGFVLGMIYSIIGGTIGSAISFYILRKVATGLHEVRMTPHLAYLKRQLDQYGYLYLLVLQFLVIVPFFIINMLAVAANISWGTWFWTTIVGSLPATMIYAFAGQQLTEIRAANDLFTWPVIVALALLILITLLPLLIKRFKKMHL